MEKTVGHAWQLGLSDGDAHLGVTEDLIPPDHPIRNIRLVIDAVLAELDDVFRRDVLAHAEPAPDRWKLDVCSGCSARPECADEALELIEAHARVVGLWAGVVLPAPSTRDRRRTRAIAELRVVAASR